MNQTEVGTTDQRVESRNAAVLDLCQTPQALIKVTIVSGEYRVELLTEKRLPEVSRTGFVAAITETIAAQQHLLLGLLNRFIDQGILAKAGNALRYYAT